jgi:hypothetical protein
MLLVLAKDDIPIARMWTYLKPSISYRRTPPRSDRYWRENELRSVELRVVKCPEEGSSAQHIVA